METDIKKTKCGFVSIIGLTNAGKSTFLNAAINEKIAITSKKQQTTRKNIKGIYNDIDSQIVFIDTPGIHKNKTELDKYMQKSILSSLVDVDIVITIVDICTYNVDDYTTLNKILYKCTANKVLLINKFDVYDGDIDSAKNEILEKFDSHISFDIIDFISALKKKNIDKCLLEIKKILPVGDRYYSEDYLTDEPIKQIVADIIRQQCLYKLDKEVPHGVEVIVDSMKTSKAKCINIMSTIICEKDTHKGIIIGKSGLMLKNIGTGARISIENFLNKKVCLKINVVVKNNWRNEKTLLANYGYNINSI